MIASLREEVILRLGVLDSVLREEFFLSMFFPFLNMIPSFMSNNWNLNNGVKMNIEICGNVHELFSHLLATTAHQTLAVTVVDDG